MRLEPRETISTTRIFLAPFIAAVAALLLSAIPIWAAGASAGEAYLLDVARSVRFGLCGV